MLRSLCCCSTRERSPIPDSTLETAHSPTLPADWAVNFSEESLEILGGRSICLTFPRYSGITIKYIPKKDGGARYIMDEDQIKKMLSNLEKDKQEIAVFQAKLISRKTKLDNDQFNFVFMKVQDRKAGRAKYEFYGILFTNTGRTVFSYRDWTGKEVSQVHSIKESAPIIQALRQKNSVCKYEEDDSDDSDDDSLISLYDPIIKGQKGRIYR